MTYRERREARAERLRGWADKRESRADAGFASAHARLDAIPFGQPIHGVRDRNYRDKAFQTMGRAAEDSTKAEEMSSKAANIETATAHAIYSDDVDALERLEARIATLEAERDRWKAYNASCKRGPGDLTLLDDSQRANVATITRVCPYQLGKKGEITYTNLSADIRRNRKRLEELQRRAAIIETGSRGNGRPMLSRFASDCAECGHGIDKGESIVYYRLTREALHAACIKAAN